MIDARCKGVRILPSLLATQTTPYFTLHPNIDPVGVYKPSLSKVGKLGRGRKEKKGSSPPPPQLNLLLDQDTSFSHFLP